MPGLYLVATPIGNLRDISLRALDVLSSVDEVLCEDTRVSGKLFKAYGIDAKLSVYNDHSDKKKRVAILNTLKEGKRMALISDAGMPLISDPGYKLARACCDEGIMVTTIPGASAVPAALQLSGLPTDNFAFIGFFPPRAAGRQALLEKWKAVPCVKIAYETGPRLIPALGDIFNVMGDIEIAVVREITKMHEDVRRGPVQEVLAYYQEAGRPKGEIAIVIDKAGEQSWSKDQLQRLLDEALRDMSTKDAASFVAQKTGYPRKKLYTMALDIVRDSG